MTRNRTPSSWSLTRIVACGVVAWSLCHTTFGQSIPNPSFEANSFTVLPGYISSNAPITGWTGTPTERVGLNPSGGSPFADNGAIPAGNNAAFLQANVTDPGTPSTLSTTIGGLSVGTKYTVTFRANARTTNTPNVKVLIDGAAVLLPGGPDAFSTVAVTGSNPYWFVAFEFTAAAASQTLAIVNDATGDQTLLVDDFQIAPGSGRWTVDAWTDDAGSGVDPSFFYTHAYKFGAAGNVTINNINFTGVGGASPNVPGSFSSTFLGAGPVGDVFNFVTGNGAAMAAQFVYGGNVPAGSFQSITVSGLTPGTNYVMTVYSVAWDDPGLTARWITASANSDYLTFNQDQFNNNGGIRISYRYTAGVSGTMTLRFAPLIQGTTFHVYGFANREADSRFVAPLISTHPQSVIVSPDVPVTFNVAASGVPLPTYRWRFNGSTITDATNSSHSITAVSTGDAGNYDVIVSNTAGSVTSLVARLTVGGIPITNPSFEVDTFTAFPGYVNGNGPITGWNALGGHGINPGGGSPFADNGVIPHGSQVSFMQENGTNSQLVSGFTVGAEYYLHYYENARTGGVPSSEAKVGGLTVVPAHPVTPVGGANPYYKISSEMFAASATALELAFVKSNPQGGDTTALIDNVAIITVPPGTPPSVGMQPKPTTVFIGQPASFSAVAQGSLPLRYQWRRNNQPVANATNSTFSLASVVLSDEADYTLVVTNNSGSVTSVVARLSLLEAIPSLRSTGIDAGGAAQPAGAISPFWYFLVNPDSASTNAIVANEGFPIPPWLANTAASKWIGPRANLAPADIATGDYLYRTTFNLANRDTNTVLIVGRWSSDNSGTSIAVNGTALNLPMSTGFDTWTTFTITSSNVVFLPGINTIDFGLNNAGAGPTGLRVEFTRTSARTLPGVPAEIAVHPQGGKFAEGDTVVLDASVTGTLPITYQWKKEGVNLLNKTNSNLTLPGVTTIDSGNYSVAVTNAWGFAISSNALVNVAYRPLPGIFGTGVDTNGALLAAGATDPHYILSVSADGGFPGPNAIVINEGFPIPPWVANGPDSKWIAPMADQAAGNAEGDYTYQTTFSLTGYDVSKVSVLGSWSVDNTGLDILVNGVSTGITSPGFGSYVSFTITNGLVAGVNTLDFKMNNAPATPNPTGLRVNLKGLLDLQAPLETLQIGRNGNNVSISWSPSAPGQKLYSAPNVTGPWAEITNAPNPYVTAPSGAGAFYRLMP